jgi:hypothetical protein
MLNSQHSRLYKASEGEALAAPIVCAIKCLFTTEATESTEKKTKEIYPQISQIPQIREQKKRWCANGR